MPHGIAYLRCQMQDIQGASMNIRREDLEAAAAVGILQYREVDSLLVFLLQRDVRSRRMELSGQANAHPGRIRGALGWLIMLGGLAAAAVLAFQFTGQAVQSLGVGVLFFLALIYAAGTFALTTFSRGDVLGNRARMMLTLLFGAVPLAVFALQRAA
jgi:hypothetical protein